MVLTIFSPTPGSSTLIYSVIHPSRRLCLYILSCSLIDITRDRFSSVSIDNTQKRSQKGAPSSCFE